jgi:hypothetical protein
LQLISKIIVGSYDTWREVHDAGSALKSVEKELGTHLIVRITVLLFWIAFTVVYFNLLQPYSVSVARTGIDHILNWGILQITAGFLILFVMIHLHVIFLRLLLLKPRVFGGRLDILETAYETDNHME